MKKLIALILAMLMCMSILASCGDINITTDTTVGNDTTAAPEDDTTASPEEDTTVPEEDDTTVSDEDCTTTVPEDDETTTPGGNTDVTPPEIEYDVNAAAEYVDSLYKKGNTVTAADYEVVGQVMIAGVKYTVTWSVDNELVKTIEGSPKWTIDVDEKAKEAHTYTLTATITAGDGTTAQVSYERTVPKYEIVSFEDYMAAAKGDTVVIEGIVVAMNGKSVGNSRNHLFLADAEGKGGYYCYQLEDDPVAAGVKIGMTVAVTAVVEPYSGMQETKGGTFVIVDEEIKSVETRDITELFAQGADLKNLVALPVSIKGVTIGTQDMSKDSSQYLYFSLNDKSGYVRTYVTDFPTTLEIVVGEDGKVTSPAKPVIDADHLAHFGYTADVEGILILYSGNPYLIPTSVTPFTNYTFVEKTAEEKIAAELSDLKLDASASSDVVIDLLAVGKYYEDVTFAWVVDGDTASATIADGKLSLVIPDAEEIVKIIVTATCGEVTDTKEFTIKLSKTITPVKDAIAIGAAKDHNSYTEEKYIVAGIIKDIYNDQYGNMYLIDADGNELTIYGTYSADGSIRFDSMESKPQAGDYVVLLGILGQYNGTPQMKNGWILSFTSATSVEDAIEIGAAKDHNTYTEDKYLVAGTIKDVYNAQYGNMHLIDANGNELTIYGTYSADGSIRYDALETMPQAGDTVILLGILGQYNGTPQMKNAWIVGYTANSEGGDDNTGDDNTGDDNTGDDNTGDDNTGDDTPVVSGLNAQTPVAGTAYKLGFYQGNAKGYFYLDGAMSGYYMSTTADFASAIDFYVEETEGGYYLYCMIGDAKTYVNMVVSGTHVNGKYEAEATTVYTYDETLKTLVAVVNDADYVFGTRNDNIYTTLGPSKAEYDPFYVVFVTEAAVEAPADDEDENEDEDKPNPPVVGEGISVKKTHTEMATIAGVTAGQNTGVIAGKEIALDDYITVICEKGSAATDPCIYAESIRLYQNGAIMRVKADGAKIASVIITLASKAGGQGPIEVTGGTASALDGLTYTITADADASEIVIKAVGTSKDYRVYVAAIEVIYAK